MADDQISDEELLAWLEADANDREEHGHRLLVIWPNSVTGSRLITATQRLRQAASAVRRLQSAEARVAVLERIAEHAWSDPRSDHFAPEAPDWAKDPFSEDDAATCGYCGAWLTVVRPGKHQCDCCSDGRDLGAIARAALNPAATGEPE